MAYDSIKQKIEELRGIYFGELNRQDIDAIEKELREKIMRAKIAELPEIADIIKDAKGRVERINWLLSHDEAMTEIERKALFRSREVWQFNLDRFGGGTVAEEIDAIDQKVGALIKRGKK